MIDIIKQFNIVDIIIIILALRICYISFQMGLPIELFKFLGIIFTTYISLHYYTSLSDIARRWFLPKEMPLEFLDFLIFIILALGGYLVFVILRNTFYHFIKLEASPRISQFGGLILGFVRAFFTVGLLVYILIISSVKYLNNSVKHSYLGSKVYMVAPQTYGWLWQGIVSKFSSKEKFNSTVTEVTERFNRK
ncbi:MAG: CvpA family protein [Candidatus Omnitrophica bacterium]|nr:CvpA family protein [Candidatus Omnitrophota bacterium]